MLVLTGVPDILQWFDHRVALPEANTTQTCSQVGRQCHLVSVLWVLVVLVVGGVVGG